MVSALIGIFIFAVCCFPIFKAGSDEDDLMGLDFGGNKDE